jgi:hypothetical protein
MSGSTVRDLEAVFGVSEVKTSAAKVMTSPSSISKELVTKIMKEFPLDVVFRDLGVACARELANFIQAHALRPADYAELPDLGEMLSERLMQELGKDPQAFTVALIEHLRLRG